MNVYPFIEAEKVEQRNVAKACALLEVSRSAFYEWSKHTPSRGRSPMPSWASGSSRSTPGLGAPTAGRGCSPSCAATGSGWPASEWRGSCVNAA